MHAGPILDDQMSEVRVLRCLRKGVAQKNKERRSKAAPGTLTKGRTEQHLADAPCGARHKLLLLCKSECSLRLVIFLEAGTCRSRVVQLSLGAVMGPPLSLVYLVALVVTTLKY